MPTYSFAKAALLTLASCAALAACSKSHSPQQAAENAAADAGGNGRSTPTSQAQSNLPQPDLATPDSAYVLLDSGAQLMFLYNAFSGLPPDFERMAKEYSSEYAGTSDSFRKHDLLQALQPKLQAQIAAAKSHPYVVWKSEYSSVAHYDFNRKGFVLKDALLQDGGYGYMSDIRSYNIAFTNAADFTFMPVHDESLARRMEGMLNTGYPDLKIFAFVQIADDHGGRTVRAYITKVQVFDRQGNFLVERKGS